MIDSSVRTPRALTGKKTNHEIAPISDSHNISLAFTFIESERFRRY